jgi:hypothetical protein
LASTSFLSALKDWGIPISKIAAGGTVFGTPINLFEIRAFQGTLIEAPLLWAGTAMELKADGLKIVARENPRWDQKRLEWSADIGIEIGEGSVSAMLYLNG